MMCTLRLIFSSLLCWVTFVVLIVLYKNAIYPQYTHKCGCTRRYYYPPLGANRTIFKYNSSCSDEGTFYQDGQKVVSFSMFLPRKDEAQNYQFYLDGLQKNLEKMKKLYPGYSMRLYTDEPLNGKYCKLVCHNREFFWCDVAKSPSLGNQTGIMFMLWRFLTLGDPTVDTFLSRDLDSVITEREVAVVQDWLQLDKAIHLMRDKLDVHNFPILGGLWGARNSLLGEDAPKLREKIIGSSLVGQREKGIDQKILNQVIFYPRKKDIVAYDSYHCKKWSNFTIVRPFPRKRENSVNDFVGNCGFGMSKYDLSVCPVECRPVYGKDWEYC